MMFVLHFDIGRKNANLLFSPRPKSIHFHYVFRLKFVLPRINLIFTIFSKKYIFMKNVKVCNCAGGKCWFSYFCIFLKTQPGLLFDFCSCVVL